MTHGSLFILIIAIIVFGYLFDLWLGYLNTTTWSSVLPGSLKGIYDNEKYSEQQKFERTRYRFKLVSGAFSFLLMIGMLSIDGFAILDNFLRQYTSSPIVLALLFFGTIGFLSDLLSTPFDIYDTFIIEQRFGFNNTTALTYLLDKLKGWLLAVIIGGGLLSLIVWVYEKTGSSFWLVTWGIITFFSLVANYFYTIIILPLFNKLTPLPDGELKDEIGAFVQKVGFKLSSVYVIDGSKRSTRGNAYFSGFGRQKKIVLYDTLIAEHSVQELVAILAHEIGHYKRKHILKGMISSVIQTGLLLLILSYFIGNPALSLALGSEFPSFHLALITFAILYSPISIVFGLGQNYLSRKHEYEADEFAATFYNAEALQLALKKLSIKNLSNLTPHPWYVFVNYSHPTLLNRLDALDKA
ncbi:MAG: M48 family metallopeptidase [Bacteroidetes bacterium]|nr:M48 family metallopeptidase [Bacteroidota bacterium]